MSDNARKNIIKGIVAVVVVVGILVAFIGFSAVMKQKEYKEQAKQVSLLILKISNNAEKSEAEIAQANEAYGKLAEEARQYVENYDRLEAANKALEEAINARKAEAAKMDERILGIPVGDPLHNMELIEKTAEAYQQLEERTLAYVTEGERLRTVCEELQNLEVTVNKQNIEELITLSYRYEGKKYESNEHSNGYHRVKVLVTPNYPLKYDITFALDLGQTYQKGDSSKKFDYQSGSITYSCGKNAKDRTAEYYIDIDNEKGFLDSFLGTDYQLPDLKFNEENVQILTMSGIVSYK